MTNTIKIGVDFYFASQLKRRGIGNYTYNLYSNLCRVDGLHVVLFVPKSAFVEESDFPGAEIVRMPTDNYLINENLLVPFFSYRTKIDFLHFTGNSVPLLSTFINRNVCATIHDTMFMDLRLNSLADFSQLLSRFYRMVNLRMSAARLKSIFTVSQYSANQIIKSFPHISPNSIHVTYQGVGEAFLYEPSSMSFSIEDQSIQLNRDDRYYFALGAREPRKNLSGILTSYSVFLKNSKPTQCDIKLVIAGLDDIAFNECVRDCQTLGISSNVILTGFVTQTDLIVLYRNAVAFIFISTEEGFGIPLLEAFSARCPIICSNSTCMPEIVKNAAILVNPLAPSDVAQAMISILDHETKNELIKRGSIRLTDFTWQKVAKRFLDGLRSNF